MLFISIIVFIDMPWWYYRTEIKKMLIQIIIIWSYFPFFVLMYLKSSISRGESSNNKSNLLRFKGFFYPKRIFKISFKNIFNFLSYNLTKIKAFYGCIWCRRNISRKITDLLWIDPFSKVDKKKELKLPKLLICSTHLIKQNLGR